MSRVLAFDVGKTHCRAALFRDGQRHDLPGSSGASGFADQGGAEIALAAMSLAARGVRPEEVDVVSAGLAGLGRELDAADPLASRLADRFGAERVALAGDVTTAHAGALGGHPGVVLVAGTGAVALGIGAGGDHALVDGWGYLLGDDGSGYAIARDGLRAALRHADGRAPAERLHQLALARFGDLDGLPALAHGADNRARTLAGFTPDVLRAAEDGDAVATRICRGAADQLAATATAAARVCPSRPRIALAGGIFDSGAVIRKPFEDSMVRHCPQSEVSAAESDALQGAHLLGTMPELPHTGLTRSFRQVRA